MTAFKKSTCNRSIVAAIAVGVVLVTIGLAVGLTLGLQGDNDDDNINNNLSEKIVYDNNSNKDDDLNNINNSNNDNNDDLDNDNNKCKRNRNKNNDNDDNNNNNSTYKSATGTYRHAAVAADSKVASQIGKDIMECHGGNAIDAAVATSFATSVCSFHSAGIGGGGFIVLYDRPSNTWHAIDAREKAPGQATEDMFVGNAVKAYYSGLAIGVPGELLGLYEMHKKFGKLPWRELVRPTIKLCQDGVPLTAAVYKLTTNIFLRRIIAQKIPSYYDFEGKPRPVGSLIKMPKLAATFEAIAEDPLSFYNGTLADDILADLEDMRSIITAEDLSGYTTKWTKPSQLDLPGDLKVFSMPAPGGGPVLNYILNILSGYQMGPESVATAESTLLTYHRIIEAFKFAYAKRSELADEDFVDVTEQQANMSSLAYGEWTRDQIDDSTTHETSYYHPSFSTPDDKGTTSISVLDAQGSAVAITSSINGYFGSFGIGSRTGVLFNNHMSDFSTPNTTYEGYPVNANNFIEPGKRPLSSMTPTIVWDDARQAVRMVTGAAGGTKIITTVAMNIMDVLWFNRSLPASVDRSRFHHQFIPNVVFFETDFPKNIIRGLYAKNHTVGFYRGMSVLQSIDAQPTQIVATADYRKGGHPDGY